MLIIRVDEWRSDLEGKDLKTIRNSRVWEFGETNLIMTR